MSAIAKLKSLGQHSFRECAEFNLSPNPNFGGNPARTFWGNLEIGRSAVRDFDRTPDPIKFLISHGVPRWLALMRITTSQLGNLPVDIPFRTLRNTMVGTVLAGVVNDNAKEISNLYAAPINLYANMLPWEGIFAPEFEGCLTRLEDSMINIRLHHPRGINETLERELPRFLRPECASDFVNAIACLELRFDRTIHEWLHVLHHVETATQAYLTSKDEELA